MKKVLTLVMVYDSEKILLGMKKRGFGAGRWNGFGGKINEGETIEAAARRELVEESGLIVETLQERGVINFDYQDDEKIHEVHLFSANVFSGEITESEEMQPRWFLHSEIPYADMWPDDTYWLPLFLTGKNIRATFTFESSGSKNILNKNIEIYE